MNSQTSENRPQVVFATYAENVEQLDHVYILAESIREFAGPLKEAPIWAYLPDFVEFDIDAIKARFLPLNVTIKRSSAPEESLWFFYAGKTFAAGMAEKEAVAGSIDLLVWMDDDTIILQEPKELILPEKIALGYRPVMHNRSGTLYGAKPDSFWTRIYEILQIDKKSLFPMITPADGQEINAYFNAGLLVVRPQKGILQKWENEFRLLYQDSLLKNYCVENIDRRIFLHQTALVGAVLNSLSKGEMLELPENYNYPLFFEKMFEAAESFTTLEDIITLRYDFYFREPDPNWKEQLMGPEDKIAWLSEKLDKEGRR